MSTLVRLKKRLAKLEEESKQLRAEISVLEGVPVQSELPGVPAAQRPARTRSVYEQLYDEFQRTRRSAFAALGVTFEADKPHVPMFINVAMRTIRQACESDEELLHLFDEYMTLDYPARFTPPYTFNGLASVKVWRPLLDDMRGLPKGAH